MILVFLFNKSALNMNSAPALKTKSGMPISG